MELLEKSTAPGLVLKVSSVINGRAGPDHLERLLKPEQKPYDGPKAKDEYKYVAGR